ncbi:efflux RND transporter periplasmic adaptor subunit [Desulfogranum mediterraneum]|uniref:efflux RND transporter periplasmic adaptor subunit n=1 Tax=Desulfogranum mediterraneum TaxID=160661 RepID=UPI000428D1F3|nr:efflux RND transporter periplasmic adaptor subunit [Desulfogranum mediterraneum]
MNKTAAILLCGALFLAGLGIGRYLIPSSPVQEAPAQLQFTLSDDREGEEARIWTCSMHPQIQQPEPGNCPICGMALIPLVRDNGDEDTPRTMSMSESSRALAEIQTSPVQRAFPEVQVRLVGKLDYDETRVKSLTARFPARIDELYVNFTGVQVQSGEHLAKVYSPELLTAQRELLTAYKRDPNSSITRIAREKLRLWGLLPAQIESIIKKGTARDHFVLRAPIGGIVVSKNVKEGDYVTIGKPFFRIVDLSELWLFLDAYESDLSWLRYGQEVHFTVEALPGEPFQGRIAFIEPEVNRKTRTVAVRVNVPNQDGRLKPGMFARGKVVVTMAEEGQVYAPEFAGKWISPMHPEVVKDGPGKCDVCGMDLVPAEELGYVEDLDTSMPLIIPGSAVLRTGKRAVVYVEQQDAKRPTYEGREIILGPRSGNFFIVKSGLEEGERVVSNGAFKIDSALQIQARPSMMNPEGGGAPPGHDHGQAKGSAAAVPSQEEQTAQLKVSGNLAAQLIPSYLALQEALAADNLDAAKASLKTMTARTAHAGGLPDLLHTMLAAESLDDLRRPHFETLSNALIAAFKASPDSYDGELLIMHCPMAFGDRGADWLQLSEPLKNPYFGSVMLGCGDVKERLTPPQTGHQGHDH